MPKPFFPIYLLIVLAAGHLVNEGFVKNTRVQRLANLAAQKLADLTEGMLQDRQAKLSDKLAGDKDRAGMRQDGAPKVEAAA